MRASGRAGFVAGSVAVLLAAGGTASAGETVVNDSGTALLVDGSYERDGVTGYVYGFQPQQGAARLFLFEQSGGLVECAGGGEAFVGTFTYGEGGARVSAGPRYGTGRATGSVDAYRETFDNCTGATTLDYVGPLPVSIDLTATGDVTSDRSRGDYHVPSELNEHYRLSFTGRSAAGTATVAGLAAGATGVVGKTTWRHHAN